jgi:hypothetical protein
MADSRIRCETIDRIECVQEQDAQRRRLVRICVDLDRNQFIPKVQLEPVDLPAQMRAFAEQIGDQIKVTDFDASAEKRD